MILKILSNMSIESNSDRVYYFDFIRAFAIFGVLACHCFAGLVQNVDIFNTRLWYYSLFLNSLRDVSVPLFVCLSGALLINKKTDLLTFIKKRFNKVVVPYIFWLCVFIVFESTFIIGGFSKDFLIGTLSFPPVGNAVYLWFVQMILLIYVLIIILNLLIQFRPYFLKLGLIASILFVILLNFNFIPRFSKPYSYFYFIIYAIFGYYLSTYDFQENKIAKIFKINNEKLVLIFFVASILLYLAEIFLTASSSISLNEYSPISQYGFLNIFLVISVFLFFRYFSESQGKFNKLFNHITNNIAGRFIFSISFCSYGIYLCHIIVKDFLTSLSIINIFSPSIGNTILLVLDLLVSWLLILGLSKIPVLNKISVR